MEQQVLENLFDSTTKVRLLKLFLRNQDKYYHQAEIAKKVQASQGFIKKQIEGLWQINFLKKRIQRKQGKNLKPGIYYSVNPGFEFYQELRSLVLKSSPASKDKILKKVMRLGRIKLLLLAGIFLNSDNNRVDLFIVGDFINQKKLANFLRDLEAEVGKDIGFAVMNTKEFYYRYQMFDRFVHDIMEKPNEKLIDKLKMLPFS